MKIIKYILCLSCLFAFAIERSMGHPLGVSHIPNKLLYILLDGFRYDYVDMQPLKDLPGFSKFLRQGVKAEWMTPIFPALSYPSWTSLLTGLWAESHGIVGNNMYNAITQDIFNLHKADSTKSPQWWKSEPIWTTATKAGLKSGIIGWSRCDVPYDGILPEHCEPFNINKQHRDTFTNNTEKALKFLENGYDLVLLYTPYIDGIGHYNGPDTKDMQEGVQFVDKRIMHILTELESRNLEDRVNIIIVSDHGMKYVHPGAAKHIELSKYIDRTLIEQVVEYGAFSNIKCRPGETEKVYKYLKKITGINVYLKKDIPTRYHFKNHELIHDILIVAKDGYFIQGLKKGNQIPVRNDNSKLMATHGFDPLEEKMRAIFYAKGPDFAEHKIIPAIQAVDVYPLLAYLLKIDAMPNNGTFRHVQEALKNQKETNVETDNLIGQFIGYLKKCLS